MFCIKVRLKKIIKYILLEHLIWVFSKRLLSFLLNYYGFINDKGVLERNILPYRNEFNVENEQNKKILFCLHWFELGGAESYALETIKKSKALGYKCYALSTVVSKNEEMSKFSQYCEETFDYCLLNAPHEFKSFIANYIGRHNIDIIHIHHSSFMYEALPYIKRLYPELKIVDSTHITEYRTGGFPAASAYFSNYIDCHNVISKTLIYDIRSMYKDRMGKELVIDKFALSYLSSMCRKQVEFQKLESDKVRITFYARFALQKLPFLLEPVICELMKRSPNSNIEVNVYGAGDYEMQLSKHLKKSKYASLFKFHGRCDDKAAVFKNTDILFLPSLNEGITLTSYEAIYHGVLPVSSDVGAQSELLAEECLITLDSQFVKNAAVKLCDLINDKNKYNLALDKCRENLAIIETNEFNDHTIIEMYK